MADKDTDVDARHAGTGAVAGHASKRRGKSLSMHEDVPVWYDCCSCEAEPYWQELAGEDERPQEK